MPSSVSTDSIPTVTRLRHQLAEGLAIVYDPMVLPWAATLPRVEVMDGFRARVRERVADITRGEGQALAKVV